MTNKEREIYEAEAKSRFDKAMDEAHRKLHFFRERNYHDPDYVIVPIDIVRLLKVHLFGYHCCNDKITLFGIKVIETYSVDEIIYCYDKRY